MNQQRLTLAGALAAGALLLVAACGSDDTTESSSAESTTEEVSTEELAPTTEATPSTPSTPPADAPVAGAEYEGVLTGLPESYPEPEPGPLTIGFLQPLGANEAVNYLQRFVEAETERLGGEVVAYDAEGQPDRQVTQFEQLLNQDVDAIVVFPLDAGALGPSLQQAEAAGVPVIAIEAAPDPSTGIGDFTTQIVQERDYHGFVHAQEMARRHPGGKVAVIGFAVPVPSIEAYVERATFWAGEFGLEVVADVDNPTDDVAGGESVTNGLLASHPDLVGVLAYNDPSAIGAATAARAAGRELTVFGVNGGSDGLEAVRSGRQDLTLQFPLLDWGRQLVWAAYAAANDPDAALPETVVAPNRAVVYTEDNIAEAKSWDEQLAEAYGD